MNEFTMPIHETIQEMQANAFARELLLPEKAFRKAMSGKQIDLYDDVQLKALANKFRVPVAVLMERLVELEYLK